MNLIRGIFHFNFQKKQNVGEDFKEKEKDQPGEADPFGEGISSYGV